MQSLTTAAAFLLVVHQILCKQRTITLIWEEVYFSLFGSNTCWQSITGMPSADTHTELPIIDRSLVTFFFPVESGKVFWRCKPDPLLWVCNYPFRVCTCFKSPLFARTQPSPDQSRVSESQKLYHMGAISKLLSFCASPLTTLLSTTFQLNSSSFVSLTSLSQPSLMVFLTLRRREIFPEQRDPKTKGKSQQLTL